ncbi:MAG: alpha/beta hydrolase [Proteobacteria bacterium]|nr:alpha/beta hydrolase [Pseudomonadota bacterium]
MDLVVDDRTVFAATGGQPFSTDKPCVLFIHGAGGDHTVWVLQARYFAHHGFSVLAVDLPGHGRSDPPALAMVPDLASWLVRVMDVAGVNHATLVGHSLGALVALAAAAAVPERIEALALLAVNFPMAVHDDLIERASTDDHLALDLINSWGHSYGAHLGRNPVPGMWMMGGSVRLLERASDGVVHTDLCAAASYGQGLDAATKVTCPVLLLLGQGDRMTRPKTAEPLARTIANVRTVVLPNCGHMIMEEQPDEALRALVDFLI